MTSTQLDTELALSQFHSAHDLGKLLGDTAAEQAALFSKDAAKAHEEFIKQIDPKDKGKHEGAVGGQDASKAKPGERELDAAQPVEKFGKPIVLMDAPASINWATPASTLVYAGEHLQWTTRSDLHLTAAHTVSSVAANAVNLFTHAGGIQAIAGNGPVSLQAHTDQLEILADKAITIISVNDSIEIKAKEKIMLQAGQSSITLEGGNITFACPGNFTVKGGQHLFEAGTAQVPAIAKLPDSRLKLFDEAFILKDQETGLPVAFHAYRIVREDGTFEDGLTDEHGKTHLVSTPAAESLTIESVVVPHNIQDELASNPACWASDYEAEIAALSFGRYYEARSLEGSKEKYAHRLISNYKIYVPLKAGTDVVVELRCVMKNSPNTKDEADTASADQIASRNELIKKLMVEFSDAVHSTWNDKFAIEISDPACGVRILPIRYHIAWNTEAEVNDQKPHCVLWMHETEIHEKVQQNVIKLNYTTNKLIFAHEFIHCLGIPDEYGKPAGNAILLNYRKPDGSLTPNIVAVSTGYSESEQDSRWNIMSANDSSKVELWHGWNIAIEVQSLLSKKLGRNITCDIRPA